MTAAALLWCLACVRSCRASHAQKVVRALKTAEDVEAFVRGWRTHFLAVMQPAYLPPHWSVVARVANSSAGAGPPAPSSS